ncbi:hypothetical protein EYF80_005114 [Liparis tanakae]|uniref:Uncharacterized protein n=1 Tax=Liparis tanakae TaxID=230148 RepID=A0A4Z2J398_9TELE|nr:hypothetical protein EYF80_005114 [Liparis tanakae]
MAVSVGSERAETPPSDFPVRAVHNAHIPEMITRTRGNVAQADTSALTLTSSSPPPLCPVSGAPNASPDPDRSRGSPTRRSKSSIDLQQFCAAEHYILIRVAR